jgi:hypothetical protein
VSIDDPFEESPLDMAIRFQNSLISFSTGGRFDGEDEAYKTFATISPHGRTLRIRFQISFVGAATWDSFGALSNMNALPIMSVAYFYGTRFVPLLIIWRRKIAAPV